MKYWLVFAPWVAIVAIAIILIRRERPRSTTIVLAILALWTLLLAAFFLIGEFDRPALVALAGTWALFAVPFTALFVWRMRSQ